jgi:hypothetical protein
LVGLGAADAERARGGDEVNGGGQCVELVEGERLYGGPPELLIVSRDDELSIGGSDSAWSLRCRYVVGDFDGGG